MISRIDDQYVIQESAYMQSNSFESMHPDDPFLKYRLPDGTFKRWLHTWWFSPIGNPVLQRHVEFCSPLPWVWDTPPDGEFLKAMQNIGMLNQVKLGWQHWRPPITHPVAGIPTYGVVLTSFSNSAFEGFIETLKKQFVTRVDLSAYCNRHFCLWNKPKEI